MTTKHEEKDYPSNAALVYDKIKASGDKEMSRDTETVHNSVSA